MTPKSFYMVVFVIVFMTPGISGAWFAEDKGNHLFYNRRVSFDLFESPGRLAVYDDIVKDGGRILMPQNDFFIPADTIDLDIPLTFLSQAPLSPMDALDRLMAANLRIKLLIDEYNALQKKADELLKSVSIPYLDSFPWQPRDKTGVKSLYEQKKHLETKLDSVLLQGHALNHKKSDFINFPPIGLQLGGVVQSGISSQNSNSAHLPPVAGGKEGVLPEDISPISNVSRELPWIFGFFYQSCFLLPFPQIRSFFLWGYVVSFWLSR